MQTSSFCHISAHKIFQPFKEHKSCPSLGAPKFGVNLEWFAQLNRIRSKTLNFWVTKNSAYIVFVFYFIKAQFFFLRKKKGHFFCQSLKIYQEICFEVNLKMEGPFTRFFFKICSCRQFFLSRKHLHLVISQLLDNIIQPFAEKKWWPSLDAPNF